MTASRTDQAGTLPNTPAEPTARRWTIVLDQLEADLVTVEQALRAGEQLPDHDWAPPTDLGPAPRELQNRMSDLVNRIHDAQRQAQIQLAELSEELAGVDRRRQAGAAYGSDVGRTA